MKNDAEAEFGDKSVACGDSCSGDIDCSCGYSCLLNKCRPPPITITAAETEIKKLMKTNSEKGKKLMRLLDGSKANQDKIVELQVNLLRMSAMVEEMERTRDRA